MIHVQAVASSQDCGRSYGRQSGHSERDGINKEHMLSSEPAPCIYELLPNQNGATQTAGARCEIAPVGVKVDACYAENANKTPTVDEKKKVLAATSESSKDSAAVDSSTITTKVFPNVRIPAVVAPLA